MTGRIFLVLAGLILLAGCAVGYGYQSGAPAPYKPHISGITNYINLNKRYLEKAGHDVFVFTFGDLDYQDDELRVMRSPDKVAPATRTRSWTQ